MGKPDIELRKAAGPFMPKWLKVKSSYKALKSGTLFKPDVAPAIERYDQTLKDYDALVKERDELNKIVVELLKQNGEAASEIEGKTKEVGDLTKKSMDSMQKDADQLKKCAAGKEVEPKEVFDALADIASKAEEFVNKRKTLWSGVDGVANQNLVRFKKARDDYKTKSDAWTAKIDKLSETAYKCQTEIGQIVAGYCDIAREADHEEIVKGLQSLGKSFYK